jgi:triacylglycerol lipase
VLKIPGFREAGLTRFIARELAAYALHGALGPTVRRGADLDPSSAPAVLFVHGHGGSAGVFLLLERALRKLGHARFTTWEYRATGSVSGLAQSLEAHVRAAGLGPLHVVGHSLGGIIARTWLQEHGGRERALSFTTLSSPHQGLQGIPAARALPVIREILAGSPLLERLERSAAVLDDLPCLSIVSSRDHFVRPWQRAAFAAARVVPVADAGHVGVLFSRQVAELVSDHIRGATDPPDAGR